MNRLVLATERAVAGGAQRTLGLVAPALRDLGWDVAAPFRHRLLILVTGLGVGITVFAACALALRCPETAMILNVLRRKLGRR